MQKCQPGWPESVSGNDEWQRDYTCVQQQNDFRVGLLVQDEGCRQDSSDGIAVMSSALEGR
jgi:hypothetical protein